jgi:tyrosyl-tRNA synthetase
MLEQGAVRINGERVDDRGLQLVAPVVLVVQVGKRRVARIKLIEG